MLGSVANVEDHESWVLPPARTATEGQVMVSTPLSLTPSQPMSVYSSSHTSKVAALLPVLLTVTVKSVLPHVLSSFETDTVPDTWHVGAGCVTVRGNVVLAPLPPLPFTLTVYVPSGVDEDVVIGRVAVQTLFGVQLTEPHEAPDGSPEHVRDTDEAVPLVFVIVTDDVVLEPATTEAGEADIE
jgi:hypothetical protein